MHEECEARCEQKVARLNTQFAENFAELAVLASEAAEIIYDLVQDHNDLKNRVKFLETLIGGNYEQGSTL